jgi:hypothetical protein
MTAGEPVRDAPAAGTSMYGATNSGIDEVPVCPAGARMPAGSTIGSDDSGAVCRISPPRPSWMPR